MLSNSQEGKDQALYFDAHVLDAQRRRHDVRGCRCRFLVRYDHDQSEVYLVIYISFFSILKLIYPVSDVQCTLESMIFI